LFDAIGRPIFGGIRRKKKSPSLNAETADAPTISAIAPTVKTAPASAPTPPEPSQTSTASQIPTPSNAETEQSVTAQTPEKKTLQEVVAENPDAATPKKTGGQSLQEKLAALKQGSISALMQDAQPAEKQQSSDESGDTGAGGLAIKNKPYTEEALATAWLEFSEQIQAEKPIVSAMLRKHPPLMVAPDTLEVSYATQTELGYILQERPALLMHLYERLENNQIQLITRELEQAEQKQEIYTNEEKFQYLKDINPLVETLKNALDLDFE